MKAFEVTPQPYRCGVGACPSVFETDRGTYVIIGKVTNDILGDPNISKKIGRDEFAVEIPIEIIRQMFIDK